MSEDNSYNQRLSTALSCARCAMHLYEFLRPGDARLRVAVDLVAQSLDGPSSHVLPAHDESTVLNSAMWQVEKAKVGAGGDEDRSVVLLAVNAVVLLCRARLGILEREPKDDLD